MCAFAAVAAEDSADHDLNVPFQIRVKLFKATCANTVGEQLQEGVTHMYNNNNIVLCIAMNYPAAVFKPFHTKPYTKPKPHPFT